jgi:hypothetical protein
MPAWLRVRITFIIIASSLSPSVVYLYVYRHWEYLGTCMLTKAVLLGSQTTMCVCCCVQVMTKLSFMTPPAAVDLRRENIEYVSAAGI